MSIGLALGPDLWKPERPVGFPTGPDPLIHVPRWTLLCLPSGTIQTSSDSEPVCVVSDRVMHDEVSDTENIRKNLAIERMIVEGCDILLDTSQTFIRQGKSFFSRPTVKQSLLLLHDHWQIQESILEQA